MNNRDEKLARTIGQAIHGGLRKHTNSNEAIAAYEAISKVPRDEWLKVLLICVDEISVEIDRLREREAAADGARIELEELKKESE